MMLYLRDPMFHQFALFDLAQDLKQRGNSLIANISLDRRNTLATAHINRTNWAVFGFDSETLVMILSVILKQ